MLSMAVQASVSASIKPCLNPSPKLVPKPFKASTFVNSKGFLSSSLSTTRSKYSSRSARSPRLYASAAAESVADDSVEVSADTDADLTAGKEKLRVVVRPMENPRLVLKFIWMEKNIGLALDQAIPGHGTIPISPYYFWPRKDAWEELKVLLESKPWISQKQMIILLNQATDIINLWQQSGGNLA